MTRRFELRSGIALALGYLAAAGLAGCGPRGAEATPAPYTVSADAITVTPRAEQTIRFGTAPADLAPPLPAPPVTARVATVETLTAPSYAPLPGRVAEVRVRLGDRVKEGDRLVLVKTAELPTLEHDLDAAQLSVRTQQSMVDRLRQLANSRAVSRNDLLVAESELQSAKLEASAAIAKLHSLSVEQAGENAYWVLAQRAGAVVQVDAKPGATVGPEKDTPIATVADLDEVLVLGDLPQRDAVGLGPGMTALVHLPGNPAPPIAGTIESVSEVMDPDRQTVPVRVRVQNRERALRPNAYVDLEFSTQNLAPVVEVPSGAVVSDGSTAVVFVEEKQGVFRRRPVQIRRQSPDKTEIESGLAPGEKVVVTNALLLLNALDVES